MGFGVHSDRQSINPRPTHNNPELDSMLSRATSTSLTINYLSIDLSYIDIDIEIDIDIYRCTYTYIHISASMPGLLSVNVNYWNEFNPGLRFMFSCLQSLLG